jgi:hypothetical protein
VAIYLALGHHDLGAGLDLPVEATWIEGENADKGCEEEVEGTNVSVSGERILGSKVGETLSHGPLPLYHQRGDGHL